MAGVLGILVLGAVVIAFIVFIVLVERTGRKTAREEEYQERLLAYQDARDKYERSLALAKSEPIAPFPLRDDERVIFSGHARRTYDAGYTNRQASYLTKTSGNAGAAALGALMAGPTGAIIGSASSRTSVTVAGPSVTEGVRVVDEGSLTITSQRVIFIGDAQILEIDAETLLQTVVKQERNDRNSNLTTVRFRRSDEPANERFVPADPVYLAVALQRAGVDLQIPPRPVEPESVRRS